MKNPVSANGDPHHDHDMHNDDRHHDDYHHDDHDDDKPVGRVLTRREMLKLLGGGGAALVAGMTLPQWVQAQSGTPTPSATALPDCVVKPELTEGPYFVDDQLNRFDIRVDPADNTIKAGTPFYLVYRVSDVTGGACTPLEGAQVDVWHCDADGVYSGVQDRSFDTTDELWLRGYQVTGEDGKAEFLTIIPGWYSGRAVHIHFKIRTQAADEETYEFTSQFFFDPDFIEAAYNAEPYTDKGLPDVPNERDNIYRSSNGLLTLNVTPMDEKQRESLAERWQQARLDELPEGETLLEESIEFDEAYIAVFDIGLDLSDAQVGASDGFGAGRR